MRAEDVDLVRHLPLFTGLEPAQLPDLLTGAMLQRFPRETELFRQDERPDFLHVLLEGSVELIGTTDDRESIIEILTPVDTFILAAVLGDTPYLMSAKVLEKARILMLPAPTLRRQIIERPQLALTMLASLAGQFRAMVRQVKDMKLRTTTERLAAYLLRLHGARPPGTPVALPVSKRILASRLAMAPENLSRAFAALRGHGITVRGTTIVVVDPAALRAFALPEERQPASGSNNANDDNLDETLIQG